MTLTEFLLEQIAADEAAARDLGNWMHLETPIYRMFDDDPEVQQDIDAKDYAKTFARFVHAQGIPAHVLAVCEAHRRIVEAVTTGAFYRDTDGTLFPSALAILRPLAAIYADRDGFREEWR